MVSSEVIEGSLRPDGTLQLDERPSLPAGRVRVTLEAVETRAENVWEALDRIRERRRARGARGRTRQEIDDAIWAMREEWDSPSAGTNSPPAQTAE